MPALLLKEFVTGWFLAVAVSLDESERCTVGSIYARALSKRLGMFVSEDTDPGDRLERAAAYLRSAADDAVATPGSVASWVVVRAVPAASDTRIAAEDHISMSIGMEGIPGSTEILIPIG